MNDLFIDSLKKYRLIAVIRTDNLDLGLKMAAAMVKAEVKFIEIAWNSYQSDQLITKINQEFPHCWVGVGTILNLQNLEVAIASGAKFIFSPHINYDLIQGAIKAKIPIIPGALSPTEIVTAFNYGATCVKVFPVKSLGGVDYIKSLQPPLGNIPLIPTGGVTPDNALNFIKAGAIAIGLSSQLFPPELILNENWALITQNALSLQHQLKNISINTN